MASSFLFSLLLAALVLVAPSSAAVSPLRLASSSMSVWDQLEYNGLPRGLLPDSATGYTLDEDTRVFKVTLPKSCQVQLDYLIKYDAEISGTLNFGSIRDLKGVHAWTLLLWSDVSAIEADIEKSAVEFKIGVLTRTYPETNFKAVPSCKKSVLSLRNVFLQLE